MKSKKVDKFNVFIICCVLLLAVFVGLAFLPNHFKAPLIRNGMPYFAVRYLMGQTERSVNGKCYDLENGQGLQVDWDSYNLWIPPFEWSIHFSWVSDVKTVPFIPESSAESKDWLYARLRGADANMRDLTHYEVDSDSYANYYLFHYSNLPLVIEYSHLQLTPVSESQKEEVRYFLFLRDVSRYDSRRIVPTDYMSGSAGENLFPNAIVYLPGYEDAGYKTVLQYYEAIMNGSCPVPTDAYIISYEKPCIRKLSDPTGADIYERWVSRIEAERE